MRGIRLVATCVGLVFSAAGHAAERARQIPILDQYVGELCRLAIQKRSCDGNWSLVVQAGMNDIDRRCDSFLTWLDDRVRSKEPIIAETSDIKTASDALVATSGVNPKSLDIVAGAFGLPSASATAQNSRLLASADRVTVQQIILASRMQFRAKIANRVVPDRSAAIRLLRNYLQLCMPATIDGSLNAGAAK